MWTMNLDLTDLDGSSKMDHEVRPSPLGAAAAEDLLGSLEAGMDSGRVQQLEEYQELLNSSLSALTTHFAQVQFRLRQICDAPEDTKESLLRGLAEFAFRGIPDLPDTKGVHQDRDKTFLKEMDSQKTRQKELLSHIKETLEDLENFVETSKKSDDTTQDEDTDSEEESPRVQRRAEWRAREMEAQMRDQVASLEMFVAQLQNKPVPNQAKCGEGVAEHGETSRRPQALRVLQRFVDDRLGPPRPPSRLNSLKRSDTFHHWGDLRAALEMAVSEEQPDVVRVTAALQDLLRHGLKRPRALLPCFGSPDPHPWDLFLTFYASKQGARFNTAPVRTLSQSFGLNIEGGHVLSNTGIMLGCIGDIVKRRAGRDSNFRELVQAGLRGRRLVPWLRLVVRSQLVVDKHYHAWSYVSRTAFADALRSLQRLELADLKLLQDFTPYHEAFSS